LLAPTLLLVTLLGLSALLALLGLSTLLRVCLLSALLLPLLAGPGVLLRLLVLLVLRISLVTHS